MLAALGKVSSKALFDFLKRPWFCRLWVLQEAYFASQASIILYGTRGLSWEQARTGLYIIITRFPAIIEFFGVLTIETSLCQALDAISTLTRMSVHEHGDSRSEFLYLVKATSASQCVDKRDRVFALLSLIHTRQISMIPNYAVGAAQIFRATVLNLLSRDHHPLFLQHCDLQHSEKCQPTWVPNFAQPNHSSLLPFFGSCGSLTKAPRVSDDILCTPGIHITTIKEVLAGHSLDHRTMHFTDKLQVIRGLMSWLRGDDESARRLISALLGGDTVHRYVPPRQDRFPEDTSWLHTDLLFEHELPTMLAGKERLQYQTFIEWCLYYTRGRSIFLDEKGIYGLSPSMTRPEDVVVQLIGTSTPMVLRIQRNGTYQVVGPAYHPPNMHGESILGKLPSPFRAVLSDKSFNLYLDGDTGRTQLDDPRLGDLPEGWSRLVEHPHKDDCQIFVKGNIAKYGHKFDPRTTPAELAKRGVELQEYRLV